MFVKICRERLKMIETATEICIIKIQDIKKRCVRWNSMHLYNTRLNTTGWMDVITEIPSLSLPSSSPCTTTTRKSAVSCCKSVGMFLKSSPNGYGMRDSTKGHRSYLLCPLWFPCFHWTSLFRDSMSSSDNQSYLSHNRVSIKQNLVHPLWQQLRMTDTENLLQYGRAVRS